MGARLSRSRHALRLPRLAAGVLGALLLACLASLTACDSSGTQGSTAPSAWRLPPEPGATWQLVLGSESPPPDASAAVYDVDGQVTPESIAAIRSANPDVYLVCYVSMGTWEQWRPDAEHFPDAVIGTELPDWPGERYVDLRALDTLGPLWERRIEDCQAAGFDAVDPDNLDAFANDSGFDLSEADAVAAFTLFAQLAHDHGLAVGQKNAGELTASLVGTADFAVVEQCLEQDLCGDYAAYVAAGKPVFAVEYPQGLGGTQLQALVKERCADAGRQGISLLFASRDLAGLGSRCG